MSRALRAVVFAVAFAALANAEDATLAVAIKQGEAAERISDYNRAIEIYSAALQTGDLAKADRRDLLRRRGGAYEWAKKYPEAEADLTAALQLDPDDPALYFRRGVFYQRRDRYDEALADLAAGKRLKPTDAWFSFIEGEIRSERDEHRLAIAAFDEAIRLDPTMMRAYLGRGSEHNYESLYAEARADYDKVLTDYESKGRDTKWLSQRMIGKAYLGRGFAYNHLDDYRRAKNDFDKVLEIIPNAANAMKWRGLAFENLGDRERALADYRAALALLKKDEWLSERLRTLEGR